MNAAVRSSAPLVETSPPTGPRRSTGLVGNFRPVREERTDDDLTVRGTLPAEMEGVFVQAGPNPRFDPVGPYHLFDGDGMLHAVHLAGGRASYRNRYVRTDAWLAEDRAGRALHDGLMTAPRLDALAAGGSPYKNTANTTVIAHHRRVLALSEFGVPYEIALPSLDTIGPYAIGRYPDQPFVAHPKIDPQTDELLYVRSRVAARPSVIYGVANRRGRVVHETTIETSRPSMMHDFGASSAYTVLIDAPLYFDAGRAARGDAPWTCDLSSPTRFGVLPRYADGRHVRWFETAPCLITHTVSAHQDGADVVLIALRYASRPGFLRFDPSTEADDAAASDAQAYVHEWRFDLRTGAVRDRRLCDLPAEFPRINEATSRRAIRYVYLATAAPRAGILKYDHQTGQTALRLHGRGRLGGEVSFVPRADARLEDDGYLLTFVWDSASGRSECLVLDARDLDAPPVACVALPARVPFGFHTMFVPRLQLEALSA